MSAQAMESHTIYVYNIRLECEEMKILDEFLAECLLLLAKRRAVLARLEKIDNALSTVENYDKWRQESLEKQFNDFFDPRLIEGKEVLDFGCGFGNLAFWASRCGARTVIGIDLSATAIHKATKTAEDTGVAVEFRVATSATRIDLQNHSIDVILCFDVLEHIMEYESIIPEWRRILRPNGKIFIWWSPYYHPYGHHVRDYAPIPWMHLFVSPRIISRVCSKMVNLPEFKPPYWDLDAHGNRRDRFVEGDFSGYLNRLSIFKFERLCRTAGLSFARCEFHTFGVLKRYSLIERMLTLPGLREFFTSFVIYELVAT